MPFGEPWHQVHLYAARTQVIEHLIRAAIRAAVERQQLAHISHIEVRNTPTANQSLACSLLHACHRFGQRHRTAPVQQIHIKIIRAEPVQTRFQTLTQMAAPRVVRIHFGNQVKIFAPISCDGLADQSLSLALAVHFRSVDEPHARS